MMIFPMACPRLFGKQSVVRALRTNLVCFVVVFCQGALSAGLNVGMQKAPKESLVSKADWLIHAPKERATALKSGDGKEIVLENGLIRRVFRLQPNAATVAFENTMTGESLLRAVAPEATLQQDGIRYPIGGLVGQPDLAYLTPEWLAAMKGDPDSFQFTGYETGVPVAPFAWKRARHSADLPWPPHGVSLTLHFTPPTSAAGKLQGIALDIHYELYDGIPVLAKWLTLHNHGDKPVQVNRFTSEILRLVEGESIVDATNHWTLPNIEVLSDYAFGGGSPHNSNHTTFWVPDPAYTTQINYELQTPAILESRPPLGPDVSLAPGKTFTTFRTFELVYDSTDRERKGLALRRFYRTLAPWATENPLMLHLTSIDPTVAHTAIDQCAEVGFEMVILSFGSGLSMEDTSPENIARFRALADYAHRKGIQLGGYSLLASRSISAQDDVIDPKTGKPGGAIFGASPCLESAWGIAYFQHLQEFLDRTCFDLLEHDGSYPGDVCASTTHPGHQGLNDSQWTQYQHIAAFYQRCRERGVYLNVPDWYFLAGANKCAMGYRETNWSLPRAQQHIHARQNLYDGTWEKTPSMGWMFVPLVEYQGGGPPATIEPLHAHLSDYAQHLANNLGYGVQACYRGPRLYDTDETRELVTKWVAFYKKHRAILESDVIHLRRADARDLDGVLHVNPSLPEKGMAVFYNPTSQKIAREIELPLYYTGLTDKAHIQQEEGPETSYMLTRDYKVHLSLTVPPQGVTWLIIR